LLESQLVTKTGMADTDIPVLVRTIKCVSKTEVFNITFNDALIDTTYSKKKKEKGK
jgi:hypothetical protein